MYRDCVVGMMCIVYVMSCLPSRAACCYYCRCAAKPWPRRSDNEQGPAAHYLLFPVGRVFFPGDPGGFPFL